MTTGGNVQGGGGASDDKPCKQEFLMEEFKLLKAEAASVKESAESLMKWTISSAALVYAALATQGISAEAGSFCLKVPRDLLSFAAWMPFALCMVGALGGLLAVLWSFFIGSYIKKTATTLGADENWEQYIADACWDRVPIIKRRYVYVVTALAFWSLVLGVSACGSSRLSEEFQVTWRICSDAGASSTR